MLGTGGAFPFREGNCLGLETHQLSSGKIILAQTCLQSLALGLLRLVAAMFRPKSSFAYSPQFLFKRQIVTYLGIYLP